MKNSNDLLFLIAEKNINSLNFLKIQLESW